MLEGRHAEGDSELGATSCWDGCEREPRGSARAETRDSGEDVGENSFL